MQKLLYLLSIVLIFTTQSFGQNSQILENLENQLPLDSKVKIGKLENGLTYYIRQNQKPENRAELRLIIKVGSILEDEDQLGLAHFMEHMAFNGTKNFAKNDLISYLQSIGVKFGADLNASTSFDETIYKLSIPTDDKKILNQSFQILEDWAHNVTLDHEEIDNERGIVIEEWRQGRGANQRMFDKSLPVLLKDSKYAERLPIGNMESLENFEHKSLERFYEEWYRPNLMAVIAIGDFEVEDIEGRIKKHFSLLANANSPRERKDYDIPDHEETLVSIASDEEASFSTISLYIKNESKPETTLKDYYNSLLNIFYTSMLNQRLQEIAQQPAPPFIFAGTSFGKFLGDKSSFTAMANVKEGDLLTGLQSVLTETQRVKRYGFTESELERFKKDFLSYYEQAFNERDKSQSRSYAQEYIRNFLEDEPIPGIEFEYAFAQKYINQININEINALSDAYFRADNRVIVVNAPQKESYQLPTEEEVLTIVKESSEKHVSPYIDNLVGAVLMQDLPESGSIASEKIIEAVNVTEIILSNGAKVILKPTDFKNDEILLTAWSKGGNSLYPDEDYQSATNADAVINECGVGNFSPIDMQKLLAGKTANARPYIGTLSEGINGSCVPKDMETMFQLMYLYFTSPNKSKDLFQSYIDKSKALYKNLLSNPTYYFYNESNKIMTQNHPRGGQFPTEEDWDKIDYDRTFEIYQERFADAADFQFLIVGNFTVDSIKQYLNKYIASLPSSELKENWKDLGIRPPSGMVKHDILKGSDPKSSVSIRFHGKYEFDRTTNHQMKTLTDVMTIILTEKIREEQSGVYGISAKPSTNKNPYNNYSVSISFPCKPENSDTLTNSIFTIIKDIKTHGVSDEHFAKVIETQTREMEVKIKENGYWLGALKYSFQYGYAPEDILAYQSRIDAVTKNDMQKIAKKYLDFDNYIYLRLLPEN